MKVVNPNNTTHTIQIIPRYYDFGTTVLTLTSLGTSTNVTHTATTTNGITEIEFDFDFTERDKYEIKLTEGTEIVYRGQLFATEQETQDFNITVNYISYE